MWYDLAGIQNLIFNCSNKSLLLTSNKVVVDHKKTKKIRKKRKHNFLDYLKVLKSSTNQIFIQTTIKTKKKKKNPT